MKYAAIALLLTVTPALADAEHRTIIDGRSVKTMDGSPIVIEPALNIMADDCLIGPLKIVDPQGRRIALIIPEGMRVPDGCDPR